MNKSPAAQQQAPQKTSTSGIDGNLDRWLRDGAGGATRCERVIETSISRVYLFRDRAFKVKKPVDLGFLDFTTPEKRRWATERELDFNRPTAPDIYRSVHSIESDGAGGFALDSGGVPLEWALEMRRFDETAVLSEHPSTFGGDFAEATGRMIARFHLKARAGAAGGGSAGLLLSVRSNANHLKELSTSVGAEVVERLIATTSLAFDKASVLLDARASAGFVRCCHGDLHLGNILVENGAAVLFDCIEFNDSFREIDVLYDLAFLLMDLDFRGNRSAANRVVNAWLDESARGMDRSLWDGLAALPLFQSVRAAVRAHVKGRESDLEAARAYVSPAEDYLRPGKPILVAVGGVSGSGKSTFARALAPDLSGPVGAVVLRSDEIRKRQWSRKPTEPLPASAYTMQANTDVYAEMLQLARSCLVAGCSVVADAVFLHPKERSAVEDVATEAGTPFQGIWLVAPLDLLKARLAKRRNDASDADESVLSLQLASCSDPIGWRRTNSVDLAAALKSVSELP